MSIRVVIVDDFPLVRAALSEALEGRSDIEVVGQADDGTDALQVAHETRPDVLLLDLGMPGPSSVETLDRLREELPSVRVLVVTASEKPDNVVKALAAGAAGYVTKRSTITELCEAIVNVHGGAGALSPSLTMHILDALAEGPPPSKQILSERERQVLRLLAEGLTDAEIADRLSIAARTVQSHLASARNKIGVRRRIELARWAAENELR